MPSAVRALASSAGAPTCPAMATASSASPLASSKRATSARYCASEPSTRARSDDGAGATSRTACCCWTSASGSPSLRRQRASCSWSRPARCG
jgi:hypothetical protein